MIAKKEMYLPNVRESVFQNPWSGIRKMFARDPES